LIYVYRCPICEHEREVEHPISASPVVACPKGHQMKRVPQAGATVIFPYGTRKHEVR
jgi:putative FmdB family regulatory protein